MVENVNLEEPLTEPKLESSDSDKAVSMGDDQEDYKSDGECTEGKQEVDVQMLGQYSG